MAEAQHPAVVEKRIPRRWSRRRGKFPKHYAARCGCGWRGPGRQAFWEARMDARAHRDGWGRSEAL